MRLKSGHTLFSVNINTLEVLPVAIVKQIVVTMDGKPEKIQRTNYDPKLYYTGALNKENALKHYRKALNNYFKLKSQEK